MIKCCMAAHRNNSRRKLKLKKVQLCSLYSACIIRSLLYQYDVIKVLTPQFNTSALD